MQTVGTPVAQPLPRRPRRRRLSRRRFIRRTVGGVILAALLIVGFVPTLRYLGYLPRHGTREVTDAWQVVRLSSYRSSVQIRVDECGVEYDGADVARAGRDVRLIVYVRAVAGAHVASCVPFERMPTHVVTLGFVLAKTGRVLPAL